jgi:hypothetical protein
VTGYLARPSANTIDSFVDFILPRSFANASNGFRFEELLLQGNMINPRKELFELNVSSLLVISIDFRNSGSIIQSILAPSVPFVPERLIGDTICYSVILLVRCQRTFVHSDDIRHNTYIHHSKINCGVAWSSFCKKSICNAMRLMINYLRGVRWFKSLVYHVGLWTL